MTSRHACVLRPLQVTCDRNTRALAMNKVYDLLIAEAACKERKEASGKVVQKYEEIYKHQARREIFLNKEDEKEVVNMRNSWLSKA